MQTSLTNKQLRQFLIDSHTDITFDYRDKEYMMFFDGSTVEVIAENRYIFSSWDEMTAAPIFWGKTLEQVLPESIMYD